MYFDLDTLIIYKRELQEVVLLTINLGILKIVSP
jgi:hypothetical protein